MLLIPKGHTWLNFTLSESLSSGISVQFVHSAAILSSWKHYFPKTSLPFACDPPTRFQIVRDGSHQHLFHWSLSETCIYLTLGALSMLKNDKENNFKECSMTLIGEGNGNPLQYSCLENPMDGGAWWAAVHGVARSRTRLSVFTFTFHFHALEKEMATHSSVLAWRIPGMGKPGGLPSMGSHRVRRNWSDLAAAAAAIWL